MSKSLQRGILFSICVALILALSLTLVFFAGGGDNDLSAPQGQVSGVADAAANAYEHGTDSGKRPAAGTYTSVSTGEEFYNAIKSNTKDILLTTDIDLVSGDINLADGYYWNDNGQCFRYNTSFNHKIYGAGHTITIEGPHTSSEGMMTNGEKVYDYGGLVSRLESGGAIYDLKVVITKGFSVHTWEAHTGGITGGGSDFWLNVGGIVGYMSGGAVIDNVYVELAGDTVRLASFKWNRGDDQTKQYVRAGGVVGEMGNGATITNVTVNNKGLIVAGENGGNRSYSLSTERYWGAAGNVVGWAAANRGSITIDNVRTTGNGTIRSYKSANIGVGENSNITTVNFYDNFTGIYDSASTRHNVYLNGENGSNFSVTNVYRKGTSSSAGSGVENTASGLRIANTLTVPNNLTLYFIPNATQDSDRLGIDFSGTTYSSANDYTVTGLNNAEKTASGGFSAAPSGGTLALGLPVGANNWKTDGTFASITATPKFDPTSYAALTKYDHGYVDPDSGTANGTPIGTGEDFEAVFSPSGKISGTDYHLTSDIVITGFTGKEFSGTLDGNGHTIFITGANTCAAQHIGGIVGTLTGTIKNVRVVLVNSVTANTSVSNANVGLVAGHINGGSLINVSVDIPADVTLKHTDSGNDSSLGGIAGSAVSGATFTNVTMNFNGTLSNIKTSGAGGGYWPFTSAFVGKPSVSQGTNSPANSATFNNIIIRGNGTFASQSSADDEPPYYAAIGIIQHKGVTNSTAAVYNVNGLIYDFNPQFADNQGATSGNHGACYGLFVNNNNNNAAQVQYYGRLVNYGSGGVYNASGEEIEAHAFNGNGNAPVPNPANIKNITETVTNVTGSAVKAYFMPGDSASTDLTLVASASNWNGVTQLQLDGAAPAVTSADDGSNKVVNVAKSTAVNISGENLTLSPYNPYTVITASLVTDTKVYDGDPFAAQVSFDLDGGDLSLSEGQYTITYTDGNATGETNANASGGTYSLTVTLKGTASDGTQYVFDAQGTKTKTFTYTITPLEVTGTWSVSGLKITYGDAAPDYDQYISIELTNEGTIPGGLTATDITGSGFTSNYTSGTRAGETVTITAGTFTVGSGFTAGNYDFTGITGSGTVVVQKRTLEIDYVNVAENMEPLKYGEELSNDLLAERFNGSYTDYVSNIYNNEAVSFVVTWYEKIEGSGYNPVNDFDGIVPNTAYYGRVQVASGFDNYRLPDDANDTYFEFMVWPKELTVTGVTWEAGFDGVFDGKAHSVVVESDLIEGDEYNFGIDITDENGSPVDSVTNAGTYTVTISADESNLYYDLSVSDSGNKYTITIDRYNLANATVTIEESGLVYTGSAITVKPIVKGGENDFTSKLTVVVNDGEDVVNAGEYTITASGNTENSGNFEGEASGTFEVAQKQLKLESLNLSSSTYTGAPITVTGHTFAEGFAPAGDEQPELVIAVQGGATVQDARTYTFDVTLKEPSTYPVNANYDIATDGAKITATVSPAKVTVTAGKEAKLGALHGENATAETIRFYESDFITLSAQPDETFTLSKALTFIVKNSSGTVSPVGDEYTLAPGTYTVTYTINNIEGANYTLEGDTLTTTLTVEEGALELTITGWNNTSPTYNGMAQLPTPVFADSAEIGEKIEEGALVFTVTPKGSSLTGSDAVNAGSYTVTVSIAEGYKEKYELVGDEISTDFTIEQREVVLNWKAVGDDDLVYDGAPHELTATVGNKVDGDVVTVSVKRLDGNNNIDVTPDGFHYVATGLTGAAASNYKLPENAQSEAFNVTPAKVTLTWNFKADAKITYGDSVDAVKALVNTDALDGEIPGVTGTLTFTVSVGNYSASTNAGTEVTFDVSYTLPEGAKANNYEITVSAANGNNKLTVQRANITVTVSVEGKTYDGEAVTPSVTVMFGERELEASEYGAVTYAYAVKGGDTLAAAPADASDSAYTVTASVAESTNFNTATSAAVEFKIGRKTLTQGTWSDVDGLTYNGDPAAPVFKPVGVFDGDNVSVGYTIEGDNATDGQAINAGSYTVTAKLEGVDAGNYEFDGVVNVEEFTIARKELTVVKDSTLVVDFGVIGETTNTYKEQIASWDIDKNKVITGFVDNDTYTLGDIRTDEAEQVVYTGGKLNAGSYYVSYTVGDNYTIGGGQTGLIPLTVKKLSYEISLTYTIDGDVQSGWDGNISFEHDAPITLTFTDNALEITFNDGSNHTHVVTVEYDGDGTLPNVTFTLGGITINGSYSTATISSVQSMNVTAQITPDDYTNHTFTGTTSFNFAVKRNTRVEANEGYFKDDLRIPSEYTGESISVAGIDKTKAFTVTLGGIAQSGAEVSAKLSIAATLNGKPTDSICDAGDYVITATYTTDNDEVVTGTYEFTVAQSKLSFELESAPAIVYGEMSADDMPEELKAFTATGVNGVSVKGTFAIKVGLNENIYSNADFVKAGSYDFTITFTPDDDNYAELVYNSKADNFKLTVEKKTITATINYEEQSGTELTLTYNGSVGYTIGAELNDVLSGDGVSAKVLQSSFIDVAAYEVEITLDGNDKDNYMVEGEYTVTITPADVTYEWNFVDGAKITYGDSVEAVTDLAVMPDGALLGVEGKVAFQVSVGEYSATTNAGTEVTFTVTAKLPEGAKEKNYNIIITAADGNTLTVGKATLTLAIAESASLTKVYDGDAVTLGSLLTADNVSVKGMKNGEDAFTLGILAISGTDEMTNAGTYNGSVSVIENCNYTAEPLQFSYKITPKPIGVEWSESVSFTYNGAEQAPTATATGLVEGDSLTLTVTGAQTNAGSYTATVEAFEHGNYKLEKGSTQTFTIKKAAAALAIKDYDAIKASVYTGSAFVVTPLLNGAEDTQGIVEVEFFDKTDSSETVAVQEIKNAGIYTVTLTVNNANYEYAQSDFTVTVSPKSIGVAWGTTEFTYNGAEQAPTATATGLVGGDSLTLTVTDAQTNAGSYTATVAADSVTGNYVLAADATVEFTIARKTVSVAWGATEFTYNGSAQKPNATVGEGLVGGDSLTLTVTGAETDAGSYTATVAADSVTGNYVLAADATVEFTIAPKTIEVGYTTSSEVYDAKGISITLDKFEHMLIEGDNPAVNIYINDAPYTGKVVLDAGEYTVRYESADPNYAFTPVSATFTVEQKHVTPNFDLNTGSGSQQITGGGKLEIEEGEETDIVAAIDNFMQSSGVPEEDMSISVSGDLKLEDMATWAPGTYTVTVTLSGNHSGSIEFTVEVSEKVELPPPVQPELPETPVEAGSGNDWVLPLVIAIVALIDLALLVAIGVAAKKRA